ncbi:(d)CMP kinase [Mycoplasmopsis felifaucium]|uniref:(d)CMP kinase n=1 Tax=Mycoplasmopsis felifaucium TaxID=35768 RepID=UPI000481A8FD|nr:(d)CMP kinase [Mycoplasmopsis felifaucium]
MTNKKINIAIDGPCGAGKSTVSKEIAKRLHYTFINSGSVYRAIALNAYQKGINFDDTVKIVGSLKDIKITIDENEHIYLDGVDVSHVIRDDIISKGASTIAQYHSVREYVVNFIQAVTKANKGFIMDGRDTTFKLMPNAELKIFLNATPEERARRRMIQNKEQGFETDFNIVLREVIARDYQDTHRETDPLHKVSDAIEIDCTLMDFDEVVEEIIRLAKERIANEK